MTDYDLASYSIHWLFKRDTNPVCDKVYVFTAGRNDLPDVSIQNSHLIATETFRHVDFVEYDGDPECTMPCP